jgi:hypothetical protein
VDALHLLVVFAALEARRPAVGSVSSRLLRRERGGGLAVTFIVAILVIRLAY